MLSDMKLRMLVAVLGSLLLANLALAEKFTIAVIPDTQMEVKDDTGRFENRNRWLVAEREKLNLKFVLHAGDVVDFDTPDHIMYERASAAMKILDEAKLPYVLTLGNHDTAAVKGGEHPMVKGGGSAAPGNVNQNLRITTRFNAYFPTTRFQNLKGVKEEGKIDNAYHTFSAGGLDWLVINLELWARTDAIEWAAGVVKEHPNHNVIVVTHSYLNSKSEIEPKNGGYGDNSPQTIFEKLIKPFPNVRFVFSGHVGTQGYRKDETADGNTVHAFLQCYHDKTTNPVRLLEIDPDAGTVGSRVYCPLTSETKSDGSTMTIKDVKFVKPSPVAPAAR